MNVDAIELRCSFFLLSILLMKVSRFEKDYHFLPSITFLPYTRTYTSAYTLSIKHYPVKNLYDYKSKSYLRIVHIVVEINDIAMLQYPIFF